MVIINQAEIYQMNNIGDFYIGEGLCRTNHFFFFLDKLITEVW